MATIQRPRPPAATATDAPDEGSPTSGGLTLTGLTGLVVTLAGLLIGLQRLQDNSFLTHLATGRLILDSGIPTSDPYSFSAPGAAWTVQSWLASLVYALVEDVSGLVGIRVLVGLTAALLAYLVWRLTAPAGAVVARALLVLPVMLIGSEVWTERPMLYGFVFLAALLLLAEGQGRAWWCVPMFAVWVNLHGSFPLGLVLIGTLLVGRLLDREPAHLELKLLGWSVLGILLGGISPIGPRLIVFPVELLQKTDTLKYIQEWMPADFGDLTTRVLVAQMVVAGVLLLRRRRFRSVLPCVVFFAAALMGSRNIAPASIVIMAAMAPGLLGIGSDEGHEPKPIYRLVAIAITALSSVIVVSALLGPDVAFDSYPEEAVTWMESEDLVGSDARVLTRDFVGNYLEARYGTDAHVFMDDRYDMFPPEVVHDYLDLIRGVDEWPEIAERWEADAILWDVRTKLFPKLEASDDWTVVYRDERWAVFVPA